MKKAFTLEEIDAAVDKFQPILPTNPFYVNFDNARGDFQARNLMRMLNVAMRDGRYVFNDKVNQHNKTLVFLAGMRGSGKTSELAKYAAILHSPEAFFVVTCNIDEELDMDNVGYMDILIFQLEKLLEQANQAGLLLSDDILVDMQKWFSQRILEINRTLKADGSIELEVDTDKKPLGTLLSQLIGLTAKLKVGLSGSAQRAVVIRQTFQNRFTDFAKKFNLFIEQVNQALRNAQQGREILFIVDGLEKTMSADTRRKIIMEESNRIRQIKVNTLFTLPIELMKEEQRIRQFAEIVSFPFIKLYERDGSRCEDSFRLFEEFIEKRIDTALFENRETIHTAIQYSGGSPRQLLRILEQAAWLTDNAPISLALMQQAVEKMGNNMARYLDDSDWQTLVRLKNTLDEGAPIGFDSQLQSLLEKEIIFEYNDGTYKRVNPLLEVSKLYKYNVIK